MSKVLDISSYTPKKDDKIFLDTNIWLYLFCPIGQYKEEIVNKYNQFFYDMLKNGSKLYTSSLVISEFFNTYSRIDFKIKRQQDPRKYRNYKKDFRNSEEFGELSKNICELINNKILKHATKINDRFDNIIMDNILLPNDNYDFNDLYIAELCLREEIKVLTNDGDFKKIGADIEIITS